MTKIIAVEKKSPLKGKVLPGDEILGINGFPFTDILDYAYAEEQDEADFELRRDGKTFHVIYVRKDYSERLGLSFDESAEKIALTSSGKTPSVMSIPHSEATLTPYCKAVARG